MTGALIAPSWIVTTATCSHADNIQVAANKVQVLLGEETLGGAGDFFFLSGAKTYNIALWKLSSPVSTDTYTRLCLPSQVIVTIMSRDVTRSITGGPGHW